MDTCKRATTLGPRFVIVMVAEQVNDSTVSRRAITDETFQPRRGGVDGVVWCSDKRPVEVKDVSVENELGTVLRGTKEPLVNAFPPTASRE